MGKFYNSFQINLYSYKNNNKYFIIYHLKNASRLVFLLALTLSYSIIVSSYMFTSTYIKATVIGPSMMPTLNYYEYGEVYSDEVYINSETKTLEYGDIIVVSLDSTSEEFDAGNNDTFIIKRLIAKGGDVITLVEEGSTGAYNYHINGNLLKEEYIFEQMGLEYYNRFLDIASLSGGEYVFIVPEDEYFYLGDNRSNSQDSLASGQTATQEQIVGKVELIIRRGDIFLVELVKRMPSMLGF